MSGLSYSTKALRGGEQPISYLMAVARSHPNLINLAAGLVDPQTLPDEAVRKLTESILANPAKARVALQYDTTLGLADLRNALLRHIEKLEGKSASEMGFTANDIIITNGSQQALYLIADCLIDPGDIVIAANPTYYVYAAGLASLGANVQTVPMDSEGMDVEAVGRLLERFDIENRLDRVKLIYCTSYYQNPTGLTLSLPRRKRLLEIAKSFSRKHRILILEDAAYRELRYGGLALPSIKSFDAENQYTILAQTFSKPFAPGLKTGYTAMPADLMQMVLRQKGNHDFGSNNLSQHILLEAMNSGLYDEQVRRLCENYRRKRDAMLAALQTHFPADSGGSWTQPQGGLYVWLTLPPEVDTSRNGPFFSKAIEHGVIYVPGDYCFQPDAIGRIPRNHLRLSFGQVAPDKIEPGIASLAAAVAEVSAAVTAGV